MNDLDQRIRRLERLYDALKRRTDGIEDALAIAGPALNVAGRALSEVPALPEPPGCTPVEACCSTEPTTLYLGTTQGQITLTRTGTQTWTGCRITENAVSAVQNCGCFDPAPSLVTQPVVLRVTLGCVLVDDVAQWRLRLNPNWCSGAISGNYYPAYSSGCLGTAATCSTAAIGIPGVVPATLFSDVCCDPVFGEFSYTSSAAASSATADALSHLFNEGDVFTLTE